MVMGTPGSSRLATRPPDERLYYTLRPPEKRHRSGVNALAYAGDSLFTGGRDGTVRKWSYPAPRGGRGPDVDALATFEEHVDWVNDIVVIDGIERLVSASSDTTIKVWHAADPRVSLRTLAEHDDYVKALTLLNDTTLVSGSLDGRIILWDLATGSTRRECGVDPSLSSSRSSIYCLASTAAHSGVIVSGSTDRTVSLWDTRTGEGIIRLRGHADSIRCLAMKNDQTQFLSGSSDATVRLWDVRMQRCLHKFDALASDSIWALDANDAFTTFVAGGRDGSVWYSSIEGSATALAVGAADPDKLCNMVLDVAITPDARSVWVSTTGSTVRLWSLPSLDAEAAGADDAPGRHANGGQAIVNDTELMAREDAHTTTGTILEVLPGNPAVRAYKVLNNRRHVMVRDTADNISVWDVTNGQELKKGQHNYGLLGSLPEDIDLDQFAEKRDTQVAVPSWFQVDIRLGCLTIRLDRSSYCKAEIYAVDAGIQIDNEDIKVNIGEHVVRGLLKRWKEHASVAMNASGATANPGESSDADTAQDADQSPRSPGSTKPTLPPYVFPDYIAVTVTEDTPAPILQRRVGEFQGDDETPCLPQWAIDLIVDNRSTSPEQTKVCFTLFPAEGSGLPDLTTANLNAPQVLRIRKVASYVARELEKLVGEDALEEDVRAGDLDIMCRGSVMKPDMSLATVKQFVWRSREDLQLIFRLKGVDES